MKTQTELEALKNFATSLGLDVVVAYQNDKRKKTKYVISLNGNWISPMLDYDNANSFMLGYKKRVLN
jgi:hypothetical protein